MESKDGGPAFPVLGSRGMVLPIVKNEGMSLRDYLAGQALAGMLANKNSRADSGDVIWAYKLADAMLSERELGEAHERHLGDMNCLQEQITILEKELADLATENARLRAELSKLKGDGKCAKCDSPALPESVCGLCEVHENWDSMRSRWKEESK